MNTLNFILTFLTVITAIGGYIPILLDLLKDKKPMNPTSWVLWTFIDILILISIFQCKGDMTLIVTYTVFTVGIAYITVTRNRVQISWFDVFIGILVVIGGVIMKMEILEKEINIILSSSLCVTAGIPYTLFLLKNKTGVRVKITGILFFLSSLFSFITNIVNHQNYVFSVMIGLYWVILLVIIFLKKKDKPLYPYNLYCA